MTITDVTARIHQIQTELAALRPVTASRSAAFTSALRAATPTEATTATAGPGGSASESAVVAEARKYLGIPYLWGGTDPAKGLDCSGLIQLVYKNLGHDIPRVSWQRAKAGSPVASLDQARPGDILAFNSPVDHVGIYIGDGKMIHAPRPGKDVEVSDVYATPTAIRRTLPDAAVAGTGAPGAVGATGRISPDTPFADLFTGAAAKYGLDPLLLSSIARQESGYNPRAVSPAGAQGLMQLMPGTAAGLGVTDSFDPPQAVDGAARLMRDLLTRFGQTDLALAAYNAGPGAVLRYGGIPPYPETQNYVRSVLAMVKAA
ncbi:transglycosylase SLT domain-containing protein [Nocardioides sp.]|uniref:transglycosylase SLT domain-containing protein n=1 Tax=Nocardioides sp. TaxID=35761 RepID=UPI00273685E4|nr:transglycosylase SLT domain-containing protein [Nocardioides sp.]MDP3890246.1 transglycosylase SLT domain-containing protein [Nocardioides sp.]